MRIQASLEIVVSMFVALCIIAISYPVYTHAGSVSRSAESSVSSYALTSSNYSSYMSNLCGCG